MFFFANSCAWDFGECSDIGSRWLDEDPVNQLGHVESIRVALQHRKACKPHMIGVKLAGLLKADKWRVNDVSALIDNSDHLLLLYRADRDLRNDCPARKGDNGEHHPEARRNRAVRDERDGVRPRVTRGFRYRRICCHHGVVVVEELGGRGAAESMVL